MVRNIILIVTLLASTVVPTTEVSRHYDVTEVTPLGAEFIANRGQWDEGCLYLFSMKDSDIDTWLTPDGMRHDIRRTIGSTPVPSATADDSVPGKETDRSDRRISGHVVDISFVGMNTPSIEEIAPSPGRYNFFYGRSSQHWFSDVPGYKRIRYSEIYDHIDLVFYVDGKSPRYDFVLSPGAAVEDIRFRVKGAEGVRKGRDDCLEIQTSVGNIEHRGLSAYQVIDGRRIEVDCEFELHDGVMVGFSCGEYDTSFPLTIDPLVFSTALSGLDDSGIDIDVDDDGYVYVAGVTGGKNFPVTTGSYDTTHSGGTDLFVTKMSADGSALVYSTFIGGDGNDLLTAMSVDRRGRSFVTGRTNGYNFPLTSNAFDTSISRNSDAFFFALNDRGNNMLYSTYLGGAGTEEGADVFVGDGGIVAIIGETNGSDFPITTQAFPQDESSSIDVFVSAFETSNFELTRSFKIGGGGDDEGRSVYVSADGALLITGSTQSADFPTTPNSPRQKLSGVQDAFFVKIHPAEDSLVFSGYFGGSNGEHVTDMDVLDDRKVAISGYTYSADFPTTLNAVDTTLEGGAEGFVYIVDLESLAVSFATLLGGADKDFAESVRFFGDGTSIVVAGHTTSTDFPVAGNPLDSALDGVYGDGFVSMVDMGESAITYSSYIGGRAADIVKRLAVRNEAMYLVGNTSSGDFPTSVNAFNDRFSISALSCFVMALTSHTATVRPLDESAGSFEFLAGFDRHMLTVNIVSNNPGRVTVSLFDVRGALVSYSLPHRSGKSLDAVIDCSALSSGAYFVVVSDGVNSRTQAVVLQ